MLEADQPGEGASGRNGGFVFAGYSLGNSSLIRTLGRDRARLMHGWTRDAVALIARRAESCAGCQINRAGVLLADWFHDDASLRCYADEMREVLDFGLEWVGRTELDQWVRSSRYGSGLFEPGSFHLQPLGYVHGLLSGLFEQGVRVFAGSPVRKLQNHRAGWRLELPEGNIMADEVVIATGGYDRPLLPTVQRAIQPVATYIAVTEPLEGLADLLPAEAAIYDTRFAFDYYRPLPDRRLLWGGRISMAALSPARCVTGGCRSGTRPESSCKRFPTACRNFPTCYRGEMRHTKSKILGILYPNVAGRGLCDGRGKRTPPISGLLVPFGGA